MVASRESPDGSNNLEPSAETNTEENSFEGAVSENIDRRSKDYVSTSPLSSKKKRRLTLVIVCWIFQSNLLKMTTQTLSWSFLQMKMNSSDDMKCK